MSDLEQLLERTAIRPAAPADSADLIRRGARRRTLRRAGSVASAAVVVVAAIALASGVLSPDRFPPIDDPTDAPTGTTTDAPTEATPGDASQSLADATRDGVVAEVAALSFAERVGVVDEVEAYGYRWIVSQPPDSFPDNTLSQPCLGDTSGRYGIDFVCSDEYGEILQVDPTADEIVRAWPLPGVPPQVIRAIQDGSTEALYCMRQGDGALGTSLLCHLDPTTGALTVRLFLAPDDPTYRTPDDGVYQPADWLLDDAPILSFDALDGTAVEGAGMRVEFDPETLALGPLPTADEIDWIAALVEFAAGAGALDAVPLAEDVQLGLGETLLRSASATALASRSAWTLDVEDYSGLVGPFSAIDLLARPVGVIAQIGPHGHCASPPRAAPEAVRDLRRVSLQAHGATSCLEWFTVDLFVAEDGTIQAVTLDLWEP